MEDLEYRLVMAGRDKYARVLLYRPHASSLVWEDDGTPVSLAAVGMAYAPDGSIEYRSFPSHGPDAPMGKRRNPRVLKIQLGLRCNYACSYCNQRSQPHDIQGDAADARSFLAKLPTFYDGGVDGAGEGTRIEFWGGEPFVYWKTLRILAGALCSAYPNAALNIITNGSLLDDEKIEWLDTLGFGVGISHDGPAHAGQRGPDPLEDPRPRSMIRTLYDRLRPQGRIGFNAVLSSRNASLVAVRNWIADRLGVPREELPITTEEVVLPYDGSGLAVSLRNEGEQREFRETVFWEAVTAQSLQSATVRKKLEDFFRSIATGRPSASLGQKCGMDRVDNLAVDLKGNVLTCQNTSAGTQHRIGHADELEAVRLTTATHWSRREGCGRCPVIQLCQGACFYLDGELWRQACDNSFTYNLAMLAAALYWLTRLVLVEIDGPVIRREAEPTRVSVIRLPADALVG